MFAVIKTGGKQYRVAAEDVIRIDRVNGQPGEIVEFGEVLVRGRRHAAARHADRRGRHRCRRSAPAHARRQGDRLQEAPAQEFAPQARLPPRVFGDPHHRDPHRRGQALENGRRRGPSASRSRKAEAEAAPAAEAKPAKTRAKKAGQGGRKKARQAGYKGRNKKK